jgi:RecA/RadA recombinase
LFPAEQCLNDLAVKLTRLAKRRHLAVLVTNNLRFRSDLAADPETPALGRFWSTVPHVRLLFNAQASKIVIKVLRSVRFGSGRSVELLLDVDGFSDPL